MSDYTDIPAMGELRESLQQAAVRQAAEAAPVRPRRSHRRRLATILVPLGLLAAAGAGAASLLATGEPQKDEAGKSPAYQPDAAGRTIALTALDPKGEGRFAVATYQSPSGQACALGGQLRGQTLGVVKDGAFRAYAPDKGGPCGDLHQLKSFNDQLYLKDADRTLVYGRARAGFTSVVLTVDGEPSVAQIGPDGAYLFVFEGPITSRTTLTLR
ncbi:MAG: hypothetical protein ACJ762_02875 [Solirubrobacteraceae bacterium]